jgi:hypothetical protein
MTTRIKNILLLLFMAILSAGSAAYVIGATGYAVGVGSVQLVNEHSVCRKVVNDGSYTVWVPTNTDTEWSYFRSYAPAAYWTGACSSCDPMRPGRAVTDGSCTLIEWTQAAPYASSPEACAARCAALGANGCDFLAGTEQAGCYSLTGSCTLGYHGLWNGSICNE